MDKLNFKEGGGRLPEENPVCHCDGCGEELYAGDIYYRIGLQKLCPDCLRDCAEEYFSAFREVAE